MECNLCDFIFEVQITWGHTEQFQHFRNCLYSDLQTTSRETYHRSWLCHISEPSVSSPSRLVPVAVPGFVIFVTYCHICHIWEPIIPIKIGPSLCAGSPISQLDWIESFETFLRRSKLEIGLDGRESIEADIYLHKYFSAQIFICTIFIWTIFVFKNICRQNLKKKIFICKVKPVLFKAHVWSSTPWGETIFLFDLLTIWDDCNAVWSSTMCFKEMVVWFSTMCGPQLFAW